MRIQVIITSIIFSLFIGLFAQGQEKPMTKRDSLKRAKFKAKYPVKVDTVYGKVMKIVDMTSGSQEGFIQRSKNTIELLEEKHALFVSDKKTEFKAMIERINEKVEESKTTQQEAVEGKSKIADNLAEIITAHRLKTDADINLVKVNTTSTFYDYRLNQDKASSVEISTKKGININVGDDRETQKEILTTSGFTLGFGYNYMNGDQLGINDFSYPNNNYFSLGYKFKTRLDDKNRFRILYGAEYQSQGTELNGNRFITQGNQSQIAHKGFSTEKAKFRQDQLVFPFHIEIGGSEKKEYEDGRVRFQDYGKWKAGIGGFAGFNMSSRLKLKYDLDGREIKETRINNFDNEVFLYGLDAYVGKNNFTIFGRMNLNNVFKNNSVDAQYVTFGIRIQD